MTQKQTAAAAEGLGDK